MAPTTAASYRAVRWAWLHSRSQAASARWSSPSPPTCYALTVFAAGHRCGGDGVTLITQYPPAGLTIGATAPAFGSSDFGAGNPAPRVVADSTGRYPYLVEFSCSQTGQRCEFVGNDRITAGVERWFLYDELLAADFAIDPNWTTTGQIHYVESSSVPVGSPCTQALARSDGALYANIRADASNSWGLRLRKLFQGEGELRAPRRLDRPLLPAPIAGHRVFVAQHLIGGKVAEMWAAKDSPPDMTRPAPVSVVLTWPAGCYAYGPQGFIYRGKTEPRTSVVRLGRMAYASTLSEALEAAGWSSVPTPPSDELNVHEISRTSQTIKIGWTPNLPGVTGYRLVNPNGRSSWSTNPAQSSSNFTLIGGTYRVEALSVPFAGSVAV